MYLQKLSANQYTHFNFNQLNLTMQNIHCKTMQSLFRNTLSIDKLEIQITFENKMHALNYFIIVPIKSKI